MIARETSNRLKKLLITDKCQQKLGVLQTTVHTGRSPPIAELQSTDYSQDSWLQSSWNRQRTDVHRRLDIYQWWLMTGTRTYLQDFCRLLTQSPSYLQPIVALLYTDFDVLWFHWTASAQKQTTIDINNCRTSAVLITHKQNKYRKSRDSIIHASSS